MLCEETRCAEFANAQHHRTRRPGQDIRYTSTHQILSSLSFFLSCFLSFSLPPLLHLILVTWPKVDVFRLVSPTTCPVLGFFNSCTFHHLKKMQDESEWDVSFGQEQPFTTLVCNTLEKYPFGIGAFQGENTFVSVTHMWTPLIL